MNNVSCEVIQDLLPLYCDGVCSEESRKIILAHVQTCEKCKEELRVLNLSVDIPEETTEVEAAAAASKAWKKNKSKAFHKGLILAVLFVVIAMAVLLGSHYMQTCSADDMVALEYQLEEYSEIENIEIQNIAQKGDYLAASGCDDSGLWHLGIYTRDDIFSDRWRFCGSLNKVKAGKLANWNYKTDTGDTILVCFGAELSDSIEGYTFTNSGVTYICPVEENAVLDFFFIPDAYDSRTHLEPINRP
ncbi:MAG: zf-HC2 domain-containing protein [Fusicatenibacter sp.]|nr:zf-HC2 domain-containing protein [Lachnospiraceae bacterium]MDY2938340.1 zf-HC2 domain-containing protein [Fusicatenibacter sp.]